MAKGHSQNPFQPSSNHRFNLFWDNYGKAIEKALGEGAGADRLLEEMYQLDLASMDEVVQFLARRAEQAGRASITLRGLR